MVRETRAGRLNASDNPLLRELDEAAAKLLDTADRLHRAGWSLGLLRPENVLLIPDGGVFLADLGFTWAGSFGEPPWDDSPGRPDWLGDGGGPGDWLHPEAPSVRRQFAGTDSPYPPAVPAEDVRLLARLFGWLIGGPPIARVAKPAGGAEVWEVLANAAGGQVPTAAGLAAHLRTHPLSDHFTARPIQPIVVLGEFPPNERSWRRPIVIVLLLGVAAGGTAYWLHDQSAPTSSPASSPGISSADPDRAAKPEPDAPSTSFPELLVTFDRAEGSADLAGMASALARLLTVSGLTPAQAVERDHRRTTFLTAWERGYREALTAAAVPARRHDAATSFRDLYVQLRSVVDSHPAADPAIREREAQCLTFAKQYAEQLGASP